MNDEQKAAARERMAKARAARKPRVPTIYAEAPLKVEVNNSPDLVLTVRRLHVGSFAGLWELGRVESNGSVTIISDANTKALIMNMARNEIMKCGQ